MSAGCDRVLACRSEGRGPPNPAGIARPATTAPRLPAPRTERLPSLAGAFRREGLVIGVLRSGSRPTARPPVPSFGSRWGVPRHVNVIRTDQQFGDAWQSTQCASHLVEHPGHRPGVLRDGDGSRQPAVMGGPGNGPPSRATAEPSLESSPSVGLRGSRRIAPSARGFARVVYTSGRRRPSPETGLGTRSGAANRPPSSHRRRSGSRRAAAVS
jgi:hypothetical protein